jgi:hypothetical protein
VAVSPSPLPLVPEPSAAEAAALAVAAAYLARAGTTAATLLLGPGAGLGHPELFAAVRDQLLAGAALCSGILRLLPPVDDRPPGQR